MAADRPDPHEPWLEVLDQLEEAVLVLDSERMVQHANCAARRLLGYDADASIEGRCRLTTRGVDCEDACPLTFALERGLDRVSNFASIYRTADDRAVALDVTIIPLRDGDGRFRGAVEILRPTAPDPGFFMRGHSEVARELRRRATASARSGGDLGIVGDTVACVDVARAVHRLSNLPDELFLQWQGSWDGFRPWPPGVLFADGPCAWEELNRARCDGWRVMIGARSRDQLPETLEVLELPDVASLEPDLPLMLAAMVDDLSPGTVITPAALNRIAATAVQRGLAPVREMLVSALAVSGDRLEVGHLPVDGNRFLSLDEILDSDRPLVALERRVLREIVELSGWRMQEAAERLGISRVTLWRKMKDLGIDRP